MPPTEVRRMVDAARLGLRDAVWASPLGLLHVSGKITATQFAAGRHWAALVEDYGKACQGPKPPRSAKLEQGSGASPDPDSAKGLREAKRHAKTVESYLAAQKILRLMGSPSERAVADVCEHSLYPVGTLQLAALRSGLSALAALWGRK